MVEFTDILHKKCNSIRETADFLKQISLSLYSIGLEKLAADMEFAARLNRQNADDITDAYGRMLNNEISAQQKSISDTFAAVLNREADDE